MNLYTEDEKALLLEVRRLRNVVRELEEENRILKEKIEKLKNKNMQFFS